MHVVVAAVTLTMVAASVRSSTDTLSAGSDGFCAEAGAPLSRPGRGSLL